MYSLINWFRGKIEMTQAKVLNEREIKKCLLYISARRHASRNRSMFLLTHQSGMRVGEVSALRICDVLTQDAQIKEEVRLAADQTKGDRSRVVYLPTKLQGNPPEKALTGEVEISRREFLHEEVQVFRQSDHGSAQAR